MSSFLDRLALLVPSLPSKMADAARFALDNPDFIALNSMRSAAKKCNVTSPTMLRLAHKMGFESYIEFKAMFQNDVIDKSFGERAIQLRNNIGTDNKETILQSFTKSAINNMEKTLADCHPETLQQMAKLLLSANTTYVIGSGSMHSISAFMQITGRMILPGLRVPRHGEATMIEPLGAINSNDAVLALTVAPYAKGTAAALKFAKNRGAAIMVITDKRSSPLLEYSDLHLLVATNSPHYYPSYVAVITVIEALLANVVAEGGDEIINRITEIEHVRAMSGTYIQ